MKLECRCGISSLGERVGNELPDRENEFTHVIYQGYCPNCEEMLIGHAVYDAQELREFNHGADWLNRPKPNEQFSSGPPVRSNALPESLITYDKILLR